MTHDPHDRPPVLLLDYATPATGAETYVLTLARRQRRVNYCIMAYLVFVVPPLVAPRGLDGFLAGLAAVTVIVVGVVFVTSLSVALYGWVVGITLGVLAVPPIIGLAVLVIVNGRATAVLRSHGVRVGFLGADLGRAG